MSATIEAGTAISTWAIDSSHSTLEFAVKHMMFTTVKGQFSEVSGTISLDESDFTNSSVEAVIPVASITTNDEKRDAHLRSQDFFHADVNPNLIFTSTSVSPLDGDKFTLKGDLTIAGLTKPVVLNAELTGRGPNPWGAEVIGFEAHTKINRKDFGVTWNVGLETGGVMVSDEVKISLFIEAVKQ